MDPLVIPQVGCLREPLLAVVAVVLFLHSMVLDVRDQRGLATENLAAKRAGATATGSQGFVLKYCTIWLLYLLGLR